MLTVKNVKNIQNTLDELGLSLLFFIDIDNK